MSTVTIKVEGLDSLRASFKRAPATTLKYLGRAVRASVAEIHKRTDDGGDGGLFRFKTPRSRRTGQLALSFAHGINFSSDGLRGSIGPTKTYAPYVYFGVRGRAPNKYMDRIAADATRDIQKHFNNAGDAIIREIARS